MTRFIPVIVGVVFLLAVAFTVYVGRLVALRDFFGAKSWEAVSQDKGTE